LRGRKLSGLAVWLYNISKKKSTPGLIESCGERVFMV
jgi:hypothetical protein